VHNCIESYFTCVNTVNHFQKPIWDYVIEGSKFFFFGLQPTYLPNPRSGILMPKPPWVLWPLVNPCLISVVSPNSIGADYVYISLKDPHLHQNPWPDILETVRKILDQQKGVCTHWRMAKSADKVCQLFFITDSKSEATLLKLRLDAIFQTEHYDVQSVWISDAGQITYHFYSTTAVDNLMHTYPIIDGHSCIPRCPNLLNPSLVSRLPLMV